MMFSTKLLTQKTAAAPPDPVPEEKTGQFDLRANHLTSVLKSIPGYMHGGIND